MTVTRRTTRRTIMSALLCLGAGPALYGSILDQAAWRAYEAVEEAWIRDRHALLLEQCPACADAANIDLQLKLAELQRRGMQFQFLCRNNPQQLRGGMWQLVWLPLTDSDTGTLTATNPQYRRLNQTIRRLNEFLRSQPGHEEFRRAQTRLWKTPEYRFVHRRYSGRLQDLNRVYAEPASGSH